jgi:hypothetical protein
MIKSFLVPPLIVGLVLVGFQQMADPEFDAKVARPAYTATHPKVLIDEAHKNFHTAGRGYKPFAEHTTLRTLIRPTPVIPAGLYILARTGFWATTRSRKGDMNLRESIR